MTNSDQKCIYRYNVVGILCLCAKPEKDSEHDGPDATHVFQPPLEPTDEAVEAAAAKHFDTDGGSWYQLSRPAQKRLLYCMRLSLEAALRVMQKGQDK